MGTKQENECPARSSAVDQVESTPIAEGDVTASVEGIGAYAEPYRDLFARVKQGQHMVEMVEGLTSNLERKSVEPIAVMHDLDRHILQHFVGQSLWQWSLVVDGSSREKKGNDTVGVSRQWCGRHAGKVDNCVVGAYATASLVDSELFLPKKWVEDEQKREAAHVPKVPDGTAYRTQPDITSAMIRRLSQELPFEWVLADDEFGRRRSLRDLVASLGKSYVMDVPAESAIQIQRCETRGTEHRVSLAHGAPDSGSRDLLNPFYDSRISRAANS